MQGHSVKIAVVVIILYFLTHMPVFYVVVTQSFIWFWYFYKE